MSHDTHTLRERLEDIVTNELQGYGAWLLNNPDAGPLERRGEKRRRAEYIIDTIVAAAREEGAREAYRKVCLVRGNIRDPHLFQQTEIFVEALTPTDYPANTQV